MSKSIEALTDQVAAVGDLVETLVLAVATSEGPDGDLDPRAASDDRLRELLVGLERVRHAAEAVQAVVLVAMADEARVLDAAEFAATGAPVRSHVEFVPDEVGVLLACTKQAASRRFGLALRAAQLPAVMGAWQTGQIDARKAQVIADEVGALADAEVIGSLSPRQVAELTDQLAAAGADHARTHTCSQTAAWLRRRLIRLAPEVAELRHGRAEHERRVEIRAADDGMSQLWAWLPSVDARQIQQALTTAAHDLGGNDLRTMDQRRADLLVDWLLGPAHAPVVHLHLLAETDPSTDTELDTATWLPGAGPLTELQTSDLLRSASRIITTTPATTATAATEPGYRPSAGLERAIRTRDVTCRFPGCRRAALGTSTGTDLDHTIPWPHGPTTPANLAALCRHHHRLKHSPRWNVDLAPNGIMTWTTPTGRTYRTEPWRSDLPGDGRSPPPPE